MRNRVFRCLVCFALICCILVNCSPIRVQATEVAVGAAGFGVLLWAMLMSCGVVYEPTNDFLNQLDKEGQAIIGEALANLEEAERLAAEDEFRRTVIDRMYFSDDPDFPDYDDGYEDNEVPDWGIKSGENHNLIMGSLLGGRLARWFYDIIQDGGFSVDGEAAPEGYAYYNGILLPEFTSTMQSRLDECPFVYLRYSSKRSTYYMHFVDVLPVIRENSGAYIYHDNARQFVFKFELDGSSGWDGGTFSSDQSGGWSADNENSSLLVWVMQDLYYENGGIYFSGSAPSSTYTEIIIPSTYFGEVPDQVRDGTSDESNMPIPEVFNLQDIVKSASSSYSDLQQIYNQVYNGDMSYQDYMDQIQAEDSTGGSIVNPDSGNTGDSEDGSNEDSENESNNSIDVEAFVLALSSFFPFCIPHDLFELWSIVVAVPQAPVFKWVIEDPGGNAYEVVVDLSCWDPLAAFFRDLELLMFIFGVMLATKHLIKW